MSLKVARRRDALAALCHARQRTSKYRNTCLYSAENSSKGVSSSSSSLKMPLVSKEG
jgi:hypothetical protein